MTKKKTAKRLKKKAKKKAAKKSVKGSQRVVRLDSVDSEIEIMKKEIPWTKSKGGIWIPHDFVQSVAEQAAAKGSPTEKKLGKEVLTEIGKDQGKRAANAAVTWISNQKWTALLAFLRNLIS